MHDGTRRDDGTGADGDAIEDRGSDPDVGAGPDPAEPGDVGARTDRHVVADLHVVPDEGAAIDQHVAADARVRGDLDAGADNRAFTHVTSGRHARGRMYDRHEAETLTRRFLDEAPSLSTAQRTDAAMRRRQVGEAIDPEHRKTVDRLGAAAAIEVLDEALEGERRQIAEKVRDFAGERARAKDDERVGDDDTFYTAA